MQRKLLSLGALIAAITLPLSAAHAAPAPNPVRSLDNSTDRLLSSFKSFYNDLNKRERYQFRNAMDSVQDLENSVDRLRSAVENRSGSRTVNGALAVVNSEYRDVQRSLNVRGVDRGVRAALQDSGNSLSTTNRIIGGSYSGRGDDDRRGRGDRYSDRDDRYSDRDDVRYDERGRDTYRSGGNVIVIDPRRAIDYR